MSAAKRSTARRRVHFMTVPGCDIRPFECRAQGCFRGVGSNGNVTNIGRALGISLEELARAAIITQANALVLLRQARADLFKDDQELSAKLSAGQAAFEAKAKYYLSRLQPNIIHRVSDADAAKNLFVPAVGILRQRLAGPRGDAMQGGGADNGVIIDQIKWQITSYRDEARELNRLRRGRVAWVVEIAVGGDLRRRCYRLMRLDQGFARQGRHSGFSSRRLSAG